MSMRVEVHAKNRFAKYSEKKCMTKNIFVLNYPVNSNVDYCSLSIVTAEKCQSNS
jgi:hypothetical protein